MCVCMLLIIITITRLVYVYNSGDNHIMIYVIVLVNFDIFNAFPTVFLSDGLKCIIIYNNMYCLFVYKLRHTSRVYNDNL